MWLSAELVGVVDAKQLMPCRATSVTEICIDSETGCQVCEVHEMSISEHCLQTATNLSHLDAASATENRLKPVRRVCYCYIHCWAHSMGP